MSTQKSEASQVKDKPLFQQLQEMDVKARAVVSAAASSQEREAAWEKEFGKMAFVLLQNPDAASEQMRPELMAKAQSYRQEGWQALSDDFTVTGLYGHWLFGIPKDKYPETLHYRSTYPDPAPGGVIESVSPVDSSVGLAAKAWTTSEDESFGGGFNTEVAKAAVGQ